MAPLRFFLPEVKNEQEITSLSRVHCPKMKLRLLQRPVFCFTGRYFGVMSLSVHNWDIMCTFTSPDVLFVFHHEWN